MPTHTPKEPGAAVGGGTPRSSPPTGTSAGRRALEPQRAFFPPVSLPRGTASRLLTMESSISDLEPRRKAPLPSPSAPPPLRTPRYGCCPGSELRRSSAKPRAPWFKCQAQCRCQIPGAPSPSFSFTPASPLPPQRHIQVSQPSGSWRVKT